MTLPARTPLREWESRVSWYDILTDPRLGEIVHTVEPWGEETIADPHTGRWSNSWVCREVWGEPEDEDGEHFCTVEYAPNYADAGSELEFVSPASALTWPGKLAGRPCDKLAMAAWVRGWTVAEATRRFGVEEDYSQWSWLWQHRGLETIAAAADLRGVSRWHALGATVAELLGNIAPTATLYGDPGDPFPAGSLNSFMALVGDPSRGKSTALSIPATIIDYGQAGRRASEGVVSTAAGVGRQLDQDVDDDGADADGAEVEGVGTPIEPTPSTSEGFAPGWAAEAVAAQPEKLRRVAADSEFSTAALRLDDAEWQVIAKLWSGETLTETFGDKRYNRFVPAHTYRWTIAGGVQPEHVVSLMRRTGGGVAQRFVWLPEVTCAAEIAAARTRGVRLDQLDKIQLTWEITEHDGTVPIHPAVTAELVADRDRRRPDGRAAMLAAMEREPEADGHAGLVQLKLATGLGVILGVGLRVTEEAWEIARCVVQASVQHRDEVLHAVGGRVHTAEVEAESRRQVVRGEAADVAEDSAMERAIAEYSKKIAALGGVASRSDLTRKIKKSVRTSTRMDDVIDEMESRGLVQESSVVQRVGDRWSTTTYYRLVDGEAAACGS